MSTIRLQAQVSPHALLEAAEQLSADELEQFVSQVVELQAQRRAPGLPQEEAELLLSINQGLPADLQTHYEELIAKRRAEQLTVEERDELLHLTNRVEQHEAERAENLAALAHFRGVPLTALMKDLGLSAPAHA